MANKKLFLFLSPFFFFSIFFSFALPAFSVCALVCWFQAPFCGILFSSFWFPFQQDLHKKMSPDGGSDNIVGLSFQVIWQGFPGVAASAWVVGAGCFAAVACHHGAVASCLFVLHCMLDLIGPGRSWRRVQLLLWDGLCSWNWNNWKFRNFLFVTCKQYRSKALLWALQDFLLTGTPVNNVTLIPTVISVSVQNLVFVFFSKKQEIRT